MAQPLSTETTPIHRLAQRAAALELTDPLGELLGALPPGGRFRYTYEDAVKLSGHSCPTVAGAYLMTVAALEALYPGETAERGDVEVTVGGAAADGSAGPISQVISLLTGAAPESGFRGLLGQWRRQNLLRFDAALGRKVRYRRVSTGREVEVSYDPGRIPTVDELPEVMGAVLHGVGGPEARRRLAELWSARVEDILTGDRDRVITVRAL